ncbi:MAG: molecular chaperone TorD family protein [Clostridia bacterium]|nr:molecular chaperone TorD family protein [Clostridia bacterium]
MARNTDEFIEENLAVNNEIKEVVSTLLAGRAYVFSLFHKLLGGEPTQALLDAVSSEESLQAVALFEQDSRAAAGLKAVLASCRGMDVQAARMEYTRLFLGPDTLIAPPWESCYTAKERALFQESTLQVRSWYQQYSYVPAGYPSHPDDHISLMMHFLALTTERAGDCLEQNLLCGYKSLLEGQKLFEKNHILNWMGAYCEDMDKSETKVLYPQLVRAMAEFIAYDQRVIDELMAAQ